MNKSITKPIPRSVSIGEQIPDFTPFSHWMAAQARHDVNQSQTLEMRIGSQDRQVPGFVSLIPSLRRIFPNSLSPTIVVRRPYSKFLALGIFLSSFI